MSICYFLNRRSKPKIRSMAARAVKAGSIITRTQYLLLTGVLKERPLWLDVVEAFPPVEPLPPPHKARHLHSGKAKTLTYQNDPLRRDFSQYYSVVTKAGHELTEEVYSLNENSKQNSHNLIDKFVREQARGISLGKSRADAGTSALAAVKDYHPTLTILPRVKELESQTEDNATTPLEHAVMDVLETLK